MMFMDNESDVVMSYLADPTSPIPSHCASIVATSTLRDNHGVSPVSDG